MTTRNDRKLRLIQAAALLLATGGAAIAQNPVPDRLIVTSTALDADPLAREASILPISPNESVFGMGMSMLDTPRSATSVSKTRIEDSHIEDLGDFSKAAAGLFTGAQFGVPSLPQIRGIDGEIFYNGIRRAGGGNGYGLPFSFNSVETATIVKGPPPAVYGPTNRVGGYVDFITKKPYFDKWRGEVSYTFGSYDLNQWQIDVGGPLLPDDKLAMRLSYAGEESGSYYDFVETKSHDVYLALASKLTPKLRVDFNGEFYVADYSDNAGWNRPTQDLIDNGTYITGPGLFPFLGRQGASAGQQGLTIVQPTGTTKLPRSRTLIGPADGSDAKTLVLQNTVTYEVSDTFKIVNRTYYQYLEKETQNVNSFTEIIDANHIFENRLELAWDFENAVGGASVVGKNPVITEPKEPLTFRNQILTGLDFRYNFVRGYSNFSFEVDNAYDLSTNDRERLLIPRSLVAANSFALSSEYNGALISPLNGDTNESSIYQTGLFWQQNLTLGQWSLLYGGRGDVIYAESKDPVFTDVKDSTVHGLGSGNVSLSYKPAPWATIYSTYSYSQSVNAALGGGVALSGGTLAKNNFHAASQLIEGGVKFSLLDDTLFLSLVGYYQERVTSTRPPSPSVAYNVRGLEFEAVWQPNKNFYATFNANYQKAKTDGYGLYQASRSVQRAFPQTALTPDGEAILGNPISTTPFTTPDGLVNGSSSGASFYQLPKGDYDLTGYPTVFVNGFAQYTHDCGLGFSVSAWATNEYDLDILGTVRIPAQYQLDAAVFYKQKNYEVRLDVFNVTDEKNFTPSFGFQFGGYYSSDIVTPDQPVRAQASVKFKF